MAKQQHMPWGEFLRRFFGAIGSVNASELPVEQKKYRMRGYGGGPNTTSLHPRQAAAGKRIVFIPGVGYRHVQAKKR